MRTEPNPTETLDTKARVSFPGVQYFVHAVTCRCWETYELSLQLYWKGRLEVPESLLNAALCASSSC